MWRRSGLRRMLAQDAELCGRGCAQEGRDDGSMLSGRWVVGVGERAVCCGRQGLRAVEQCKVARRGGATRTMQCTYCPGLT